MTETEEGQLFANRSIQTHRARGRVAHLRRSAMRALEAGADRIVEIVGSVSAQLVGRATRPLAVIPVQVRDGSPPPRGEPSGGRSSVWVASPSATRARQG